MEHNILNQRYFNRKFYKRSCKLIAYFQVIKDLLILLIILWVLFGWTKRTRIMELPERDINSARFVTVDLMFSMFLLMGIRNENGCLLILWITYTIILYTVGTLSFVFDLSPIFPSRRLDNITDMDHFIFWLFLNCLHLCFCTVIFLFYRELRVDITDYAAATSRNDKITYSNNILAILI